MVCIISIVCCRSDSGKCGGMRLNEYNIFLVFSINWYFLCLIKISWYVKVCVVFKFLIVEYVIMIIILSCNLNVEYNWN